MSDFTLNTSQTLQDTNSYNFDTMKVTANGQDISAVQGFSLKADYPPDLDQHADDTAQQTPLSHEDKLSGYVQTSGQLGGALGLVASGLLEGNMARAALGGFNAFRSSTKLISDFNAKSRSSSHRNDVVESGVATSANSVGYLNVRSPEELLAVTMLSLIHI